VDELGYNVYNTENIHGVGTDETTGAQLAILALAADKSATTPERTGPIPLLAPVSRVTEFEPGTLLSICDLIVPQALHVSHSNRSGVSTRPTVPSAENLRRAADRAVVVEDCEVRSTCMCRRGAALTPSLVTPFSATDW
tara:strand:- start:133 stop:549 length:417 start_codon:yes stop_codon:yes gene_type:complete